MIRTLIDRLTYRTPAQNPTLARYGVLGRSFAGQSVHQFGPPPAEYFAADLAGLADVQLVTGPQRRTPAAVVAPTLRERVTVA